ncbi:MAG: uroporphyrinogen decarboxylase family protein [Kiritimatiellia bacterium]
MNAKTDWNTPPLSTAAPDFENLLAVLRGQKPGRPTLFEFFLNGPLYRRLARMPDPPADNESRLRMELTAFKNAGYDYAHIGIPNFGFPGGESETKESTSLNMGGLIKDRASFDAYDWPDPGVADYGILDRISGDVPSGMKYVASGPCGVLENVIGIVGFDTLCYMIIDDAELAGDVFESVGSLLVRYYERVVEHPVIGAVIGNDDWGFKSQTMISPDHLRKYVFPWHAEIVSVAHRAGKPAILHSCGNLASVMDDVIDGMKYDGKHSYEDTIEPVEEAYNRYHGRIAVMGGIDVDFVCRSDPEKVYERSASMLELSSAKGAYALGTGNSVPEYVPDPNYFAMIRAALDAS